MVLHFLARLLHYLSLSLEGEFYTKTLPPRTLPQIL